MPDDEDDALPIGAGFDGRRLGNELRKESLDPYNRLHSIELDATFVGSVVEQFAILPVIANQRCGAWYVDPAQAANARAYFKSTDGHTSQWAFSMRRANLHLLKVISEHRGLIIVDATRRGKTFPDALSKTIPLWCAVINAAKGFGPGLTTPESVVSASEHAQMALKIAPAAADLLAVDAAQEALAHLKKPLKPVFVSRAAPRPTLPLNESLYFIICLSASDNEMAHARQHGFTYVPGAGDDHESWSQGLTPALFWPNHRQILSASRDDLQRVIQQVVHATAAETSNEVASFDLEPTVLRLDFQPTASVLLTEGQATIVLCSDDSNIQGSPSLLVVGQSEGKRGHKALVDALPKCLAFARAALGRGAQLCISCIGSGRQDAATGLTLALLVSLYDDDFNFSEGEKCKVTKAAIKQRLTWLTTLSAGRVNPSRAILTRLNGALIHP